MWRLHHTTSQPSQLLHERSASGLITLLTMKFPPRKFLFSNDQLHQIVPKQIHRKFFQGFSQNNFPAHATNARFAIFQKCRIAPFARIPASKPRPVIRYPQRGGHHRHIASPLLPIYQPAPCRDSLAEGGQNVITTCSPSAGIKSGHSGQMYPYFRKSSVRNVQEQRSRK